MTTKEIKEQVFDIAAVCAGQEISLSDKDLIALKHAFKALSKLEKIEQIINDIAFHVKEEGVIDAKYEASVRYNKICEVLKNE